MNELAAGLDLDAASPSLVVGRAEQQHVHRGGGIPPSLVVSSSRQIPFALDSELPTRVEGSGVCGTEDPTRVRVPLAYAWELLQHNATAEVLSGATSAHRQGLRASDLVASAAVALLAGKAPQHTLGALVVPNILQEQAQDRLLSETRRLLPRNGSRARVELVWRPVAAALRWLQDHGPSLTMEAQPDFTSVGGLLHVHLGLDSFEVTRLEVLTYSDRGTRWLLPGRRLPAREDSLVGFAMHAVEQLFHERARTLAADAGPTFRYAWNALWAATTLGRIVAPSALTPDLPPWIPDSLASGVRAELGHRILEGQVSGRRWLAEIEEHRRTDSLVAREWMRHVAEVGKAPLLGAVVTGTLTTLPCKTGRSLGEELAQRCGVPTSRLLIDQGSGPSLLAEGAAIYADRRTHERPTHLDTLPRVTTIVTRRGDPVWKDLLQHDHAWVVGGRPWRHKLENDFAIARGESGLLLTVHREGAERCRAVGVEFGRQLDRDVAITLSIEMEPGQGHPRVEVVPHDWQATGGRTLFLDWSFAPEVGAPEEELDNVPRLCPPSEPRLASKDRWTLRQFQVLDLHGATGVRALVMDYLQVPERWTVAGPRKLDYMNACLREARLDPEDRLCSTVASDGTVHGLAQDRELLGRFVDAVDRRLNSVDADVQRECTKILGSCSASTPNLLRRLRGFLRRGAVEDRFLRIATLWACGNCIREPDDVRLFFEFADRTPFEYPEAQALAHVLMYREDALEDVDSRRVEAWLRKLLPLLGSRPARRRMDVTQNRAAMAIAYLLRRRCYDPGFLAPGSASHAMTRAVVEAVLRPVQSDDTVGMVKTFEALREILDYLDRKGRGRLTALMVDGAGEA